MTRPTGGRTQKARFYASIQLAQVAWVGIALAFGGAFAVPSLPLFVATMGGMLLILALARRNPTYARLREESKAPAA